MQARPAVWTLRFTGFLTVVSLYAHTLVGVPSSSITPIIAALLAISLWLTGVFEAGRLRIVTSTGAIRLASIVCLGLSLVFMSASALFGFATHGLELQEIGVFAIQVGVPILVLLNPRRLDLVMIICRFCVLFSLCDLIANLLALFGFVDLAHYSGRLTEGGVVLRYPGISGNTHASGLVAMIAIIALSFRLTQVRLVYKPILLSTIFLLFASLILIDARRYLVEAAVGCSVVLLPPLRKIPASLLIVAISGSALWATFRNILDPLDDTRARLMLHGFRKALTHPLIGAGVTYVPPSYDQPGYEKLAAAGVTESGVLDLAIAYGVPAMILFLASCALAVLPFRRRLSLPLVIATLLISELMYGTPISGFLGSVLFFSSLIFLLQDDVSYEKMDWISPWRKPSSDLTPSSLHA